jgi:hypothetical protein
MKLKLELGDMVEITLPDGKLVYDTITEISENEILGKKYDLTYSDFKVVTIFGDFKI